METKFGPKVNKSEDGLEVKFEGKAKAYCFTLNNYSEEMFETLKTSLNHKYLVMGREVAPTTGTHHIQGYVEFSNGRSFKAVHKLLYNAHMEVRSKGSTPKQAADYCKKDKDFYENGVISHQGVSATATELVEDIIDGMEEKDIILNYPSEYFHTYRGIREAMLILKPGKDHIKIASHILYPWQTKIMEYLGRPVSDRTIYWIVDYEGNKGKTYIAKYIINAYKDVAYFTNAKSADIAHAYNGESIVIFDFTRSSEYTINYQIIESIKNGLVFSGKYDSKTKIYDIPYVICFSNFDPNRSAMSLDRWIVHHI